MPDFIRLTDAGSGCKIVVVTAMIGAVAAPCAMHGAPYTQVVVAATTFAVRESAEHVLGLMGVPEHRTVFDERDVPIHELTNEELVSGWQAWAARKSAHAAPWVVMFEAELKRRGIVIGGASDAS